MTIKLKPITETSWLVLGDTEETKIGLLTAARNQYTLIAGGEKKKFLSELEVNNYFKENIFNNIVESESSPVNNEYYINGYPVDFDNPHQVFIKGKNLPLFSKKSSSETYYSAGYYCLHFPKNWMSAFCPKLSTLDKYEFRGPFKTELEMKTELSRLRKSS